MASGKTLKTTIAIGGKLLPSFNTAFGSVNSQMMKANARTASLAKTNSRLTSSYKTLGYAAKAAAIGVAYGAASMVSKGIQLSSDLAESQNVIDVTFGESKKAIGDWAKTAQNAYGLSELAAKQYTGTMGAMLKSTGLSGDAIVGMSTDLAGLAGDFASFYNLSNEEAFTKIRSGISGETEPLKQLGIDMSVANLQAYALSKGIKGNYSDMNAATKAALRYSYLMSVSADAQGDFTRTSESFANQQRLLKLNMEKVSMTLSSGLVPVLAKMFNVINNKLEKVDMDKVADKITAFGTIAFNVMSKIYSFTTNNWPVIKTALQLAAAYLIANKIAMIGFMAVTNAGKIKVFASNLLWWISSLNQSRKAIGLIKTAQLAWNLVMTANPVGAVTMAIFALGTAIYALYKNWDKVVSFFKKSWETIKKIFGDTSDANTRATARASTTAGRGMRRYARGGFASVPSIFGEAGPEVAIPLNKTPRSISLLNRTAAILGIGGGGISFSPIIYVDGGKGNVEGQVSSGIRAAYPEFERIIDKYREGREVYA